MIACQCRGVSDRTIRTAVRAGAVTVAGVGLACNAGADCGGCHETIERIIRIELAAAASARKPADPMNPKGPLLGDPAPA